jgi:hypothetical protein
LHARGKNCFKRSSKPQWITKKNTPNHFTRDWHQRALRKIRRLINAKPTPNHAHLVAALNQFYKKVAILVLAHVNTSNQQPENKKAVARLYGENGQTLWSVTDVAAEMGKNHQIVSQAEEAIHRKVRQHSDYPALELQWMEKIKPAINTMGKMAKKSEPQLMRSRLNRLFK